MISVLLTPLVPALAFLFPGIFIVKHHQRSSWHFLALASIWSLAINSLLAFVGFLFHFPPSLILTAWLLINIILTPLFIRRTKTNPISLFYIIGGIFIFFLTYLLLVIPYINLHDALPTGDSQKAIFWGQQILQHNSLPDYQIAATQLNRDPQDFFTPALHSLTALIMFSTPHPLIAVGFLAIAASILTAITGAAIAQKLVPNHQRVSIAIFAFLLTLTQLRFLRYVREPGYHFQNIFGELLLFGIILLILTFIKDRLKRYLVLIILALATLFLTHQFTTFVAAFTILPILIYLGIHYRANILTFLTRHKYITSGSFALLFLAILLAFQLNLHTKLPHIFNSNPHLSNLSPSLNNYPRLMGLSWLILAMTGLTLMIGRQRKKMSLSQILFIIFTVFLITLSQAPTLFIDIPPIRALFYSALPLSIFGAYLLSHLFSITRSFPAAKKLWARIIITTVIAVTITTSTTVAFNTSHTVRTNSTFLPAYQILIDYLDQQPGNQAVLTDDYNRRGSSWLLLSHHPMLTRISGDLERQMDEAYQSPARRTLYLQQLDFEKIFSLGSRPEALQLLTKYNIGYITGIDKSSATSFSHSPILTEARRGSDIIIFQQTSNSQAQSSPLPDQIVSWLLKPTTLVNDIGDAEDTFKHLPVSLSTTRLSDPVTDKFSTYRTTTAPIIPIKINIGDYVRILVDQDQTNILDVSLELLLLTNQDTLNITTSTGHQYTYSTANPLLKIRPDHVPIDDQGFITLYIDNLSVTPIDIDLIAVGLSSIP